jgi:hypothetical protein
MNSSATLNHATWLTDTDLNGRIQELMNGEIFTQTQSHTDWGGSVTAWMYLPLERSQVWQQLTNYPRWVHYFPDMIRSEVIVPANGQNRSYKRLYQVARKAFFMLSAQVEIYLKVFETAQRNVENQIQFYMEKGDFKDFSASLKLSDYQKGTLLSYTVQATPTIPVPSILIQEAMRLDLPANMRKMRQVICDRS